MCEPEALLHSVKTGRALPTVATVRPRRKHQVDDAALCCRLADRCLAGDSRGNVGAGERDVLLGAVRAEGGTAAVERNGESYYFVIPLRNVGNGLAVLQAWRFVARRPEIDTPHAEPAEHRPQTRDLYVPAGDTGFWQGAIREGDDPFREGLREAFLAGVALTVDLLYGDHEGGQLTISHFILTREEDGHWLPGNRPAPPSDLDPGV